MADAERDAAGGDRQGAALKLWIVLWRATEAVTEHARADVARHDLTLAEFAILECLYHKGPRLLGEVQRKILVSSGGISYLVDRLEQKGLVTRVPCEQDRRATWAHLTPSGRELIAGIFPDHAARIEQAMRGLSTAQIREATALLRTLGLAAENDRPRD